MNKWYQGIVVHHKEIDNKMYHCFDDENFKILTEERNEQLKEIERLNNIINESEENCEKIVEMLSNGNFLQLNGKAINLTELNEYINAQQEEIERLNNIINEVREYLTDEGVCILNKGKKENERLVWTWENYYDLLEILKGSDIE